METPGACPRCNRAIPGSFPRCFYCGWSKDPVLLAAAEAGQIVDRTFRCGGKPWVSLVGALPLLLLGLLFWLLSGLYDTPSLGALPFRAAALGAFILVPIWVVVRAIRRRFLRVRTVPGQGLELHGRRMIPWEQIRRVEDKRSLFGNEETIFGARPVVLTLRSGERIVLRDLEDRQTFLRMVHCKVFPPAA